MAAVGFATLPVIPSFDGISARIDKAISQPIRKASKDAGDALSKGVGDGADAAAKAVEKANFRVKKSTQELEVAESKLTEQKNKSEAANLAVESAARKREEAEGKGIEAVSKAEQDLLKKRAAAERESRNLIRAEESYESALTESARAAESLEKRQEELSKANDGSSRTFRELREEVRNAGDELDETANKASAFGDKFTAGLAEISRGALLGIGAKIGTTIMGGVQEAVSTGWETAMSLDQVSRSLSAMTSETQVAEDMMVSLREVASDRPIDYTSFLEGANTLAYMGYEGEQAIKVMDNVGRAAVGAGRDGDDAMQTVIGALGKMQANGKVTAEEIGQISNSGVPMLSALIDHFGMAEGSFGELSSMISEGKVDLEDVIGALEEAGGADFENLHNSFENVNSSLENQIAMLKDDVFTSIGESLQPILQDMDFEAIADTVGDVVGRIISLLPGMVEIAMTAFDNLGGVIGDVSGVLESVWGWIEKNKDALKALAVGVGIAVGAWKLFTGAMALHAVAIQIADKGWKGYIASTKIATAVTKLFNKATKANIIGIIATALIAVGGALVYFFTQTETGRELWEKFTGVLADGWDWLTDKLGGGIDWITEKFSEFTGWLTDTWNNITGWVSDAWNGIVSLFQGDFTSEMREAFGVEEDSPIIGFFFTIRDAVISVGDFISAFWDGLVNAAQWVISVLGTVLITPFVLYWNVLSGAVEFAWENVIKPAWDAMASAATWLWENVLSPVFTWIGDKWTELSETFSSVWETIKTAVFDAFTWYIDRVKANFEIVTGALNTAWTWVKDQFLIVWGFIRDLVFTAWNNAVNNVKAVFTLVTTALSSAWAWLRDMLLPVWETIRDAVFHAFENVVRGVQFVFETVTGAISGAWSWLSDMLHAGWVWIKENVFDAMGRGLDTVEGWFQTGVDSIKSIWDGLKRKLAEPINFVIRTVYNDGIKKVFDGVAEKVGLDARLPTIKEIGGFASGGILPGYTPGRDPYTFIEPRTGMTLGLSGGEAVLRPEATRALGKDWVDNVNRAARVGGERGVADRLRHSHFANGGHIGNFANGGFINYAGALSAVQASHAAFVGKHFPDLFALTSASRSEPGSFHDYGAQKATDWQAQDGQHATQMPTAASKKLARAIYMNFPNSAELIHWPLDGWQNLDEGRPHDFGAGTNAGHANHVHWATHSPLRFEGKDLVLDDAPGGGGFSFNPLDWFEGLWSRIIDKLPKFNLQGFGDMAEVPEAALNTFGKWIKDWGVAKLKEWADKFMNFLGIEGGGAEQWRDLASEALKRMGYGDEHLAAMLQQIQIESGGDPRAVNNWDSNAAKGTPSGGLLQVIEPTYRDVRNRYPDAFEGLPDDRFHPLTNLVAGVGAVKRDWGGPAGRWPTKNGYATGGVLPGFTPGRDVHRFFSPTGGALALSGGEAIMVPEWTRAVGGPSAVAAMNAAASGGRAPGVPGAFAAGGVWSGITSASDDFVKKFNEATKNLNEAATKLADASTDEGLMARSGLTKLAEGFGLIGFGNSASVINSVLGAEQQLMEAREGYSTRIAAISEAEKEHAEALKELDALRKSDSKMSVENQRKLADAQKAVDKAKAAQAKASSDKQAAASEKVADAEEKLKRVREDIAKDADKDAQAHADEMVKATERVTAAEEDLAQKRKESVAALDVTIFEVAPQISGMLSQAAKASSAIPQVSSALAGMAAMAGPAGISVGVAVQGVLTAIDLVQKIGTAIGDFVSSIFAARTAMYSLTVQGLESVYEAAKTVDDLRASVVGLRISWVEAQVSLRDAAWKTRLAQADVVRAQLEGVRSVADAEAALEKERKRVARAAALHFDDLSLMYDRYRWLEYEGMFDRLDLAAQITPEILALEAEVNAAKLTALANQRSASLSALQASWEQQKAALNLQQVQANLAMQTQQLALMQAEFGGFGQAGSLQAMNTAKLYEERSKIQQQMGQNFWRLSYHLTGASAADKKRIAELDKLIAEREASGAGIGKTVGGTDWMSFFGYGDSASNALKNSGYGDAETALWKLQELQQLQQIEQQAKELEQQIEQNKLFEEYQKQIGELTAEIESLKAGASASQYEADSYREDNPAVKAALEALAKFEAGRSKEYGDVAAGRKQIVEITIPEQDTYTREQVDALLSAVQEIGSIDARVRMLETPAKPGANQVLQDITRRY
ncbi:tape measure protein [Corynebacterium stationis]|uniref:tape measure protein n=1 Tax=Corynebacterium stationis TaxID=1705 RepID=UPI000B59B8D7|nr:tape measure protein [Corynebacterium stationis]ASJ17841.1 hypothetical protein BA700_01265 [Corynebacterium stationis]